MTHLLLLLLLFVCGANTLRYPRGEDINHIDQVTNCRHVFRNQTFGIVASPGYPAGYPDTTSCVWDINIPEGKQIALTVKTFVLGPGDRLTVVDGGRGEGEVYSLGRPPDDVIYSSTNQLTVSLSSAQIPSGMVDSTLELLKSNRTFYAMFEVEGCGGSLSEGSGHITVPSYIHLSQRSHQCVWNILAPTNRVVVLNFLQFDLTPGTCLYSKLHIRDGDRGKGGYVLGDFCEENPPLHELRTATNTMYISYRSRPNFLTKHSEVVPIIRMYYYVADACGGKFSSYSGSFSTPHRWLDDVYSCNWTITVPQGKQIALKIYNWRTSNSSEEEFDQLVVQVPDKLPRVWSSREQRKPRMSTIVASNQLSISLLSHRERTSTAKIGFYAVYEAIQAPVEQCIDVGAKRLFLCDDWKYIECSLRCNGQPDCENGKDEEKCSLTSDNFLDIRHDHHKKSVNISVYFTFLFVAICVSLVIVVASLTFNHCYKYNQRKYDPPPRTPIPQPSSYPSIFPPPSYPTPSYQSSKDSYMGTYYHRQVGPYPYSFDETNITEESSLRQSLVAVCSVANNSMNESQSTTDTDRLRDFDVPMVTEYNTRSMDTLFMIEEGTFEGSSYGEGEGQRTSRGQGDDALSSFNVDHDSPILPSSVAKDFTALTAQHGES